MLKGAELVCYKDGGLIETVGLRGCTIKRGKVGNTFGGVVHLGTLKLLCWAFDDTPTEGCSMLRRHLETSMRCGDRIL